MNHTPISHEIIFNDDVLKQNFPNETHLAYKELFSDFLDYLSNENHPLKHSLYPVLDMKLDNGKITFVYPQNDVEHYPLLNNESIETIKSKTQSDDVSLFENIVDVIDDNNIFDNIETMFEYPDLASYWSHYMTEKREQLEEMVKSEPSIQPILDIVSNTNYNFYADAEFKIPSALDEMQNFMDNISKTSNVFIENISIDMDMYLSRIYNEQINIDEPTQQSSFKYK